MGEPRITFVEVNDTDVLDLQPVMPLCPAYKDAQKRLEDALLAFFQRTATDNTILLEIKDTQEELTELEFFLNELKGIGK